MNSRFSWTLTLILAAIISASLLTGCNTKTTGPSLTENPSQATMPNGAQATVPSGAQATMPVQEPTSIDVPATATQVPTSEVTLENPTATPTSEPASPTADETAEPTPAPTATEEAAPATSPESPPAEETASCTDIAAFYKDVTVEDYTFFNQKETFVKTWQVRNEGTCTWGAGYSINFDSGFTLEAPQSSPLPEAAPGQTVDISLQMTAPERGGQYISRWRFKNSADRVFGIGLENGQLFTIINVGFINPDAQATQTAPRAPAGGNEAQPTPDPASSSAGCSYSLDPSFANQLIGIINQARQQAGLNALTTQSQLAAAAQVHSIDLACTDGYDHIGSDGSVWTERVARQGYANFTSARENIRVGNPDFGFSPQYVFDRWFESQIHRENMYFTNVSEIGLACVLNPDSEYKEFCTALFARP